MTKLTYIFRMECMINGVPTLLDIGFGAARMEFKTEEEAKQFRNENPERFVTTPKLNTTVKLVRRVVSETVVE